MGIKEENLRAYYVACKYIYSTYGMQHQKQQLIQELAELIVALTKNDLENIIEEMADVQVMMDQFTIANPIWDKKIENMKIVKARRQLERMKNN